MASLFKKLKIPLPGGTVGKYGTVGKIGAALALGPALGPVNPYSMDPDVLGARGSASRPGKSVDRARDARAEEVVQAALEATHANNQAREAQAQAEAKRAQETQLAARRRNRRFAYGYDRATGGSGGLGGTGGRQKTLLGY